MQGLPTEDELVTASYEYGEVKWPNVEGIYAAGHWLAGARWVMDKLSGSPAVGQRSVDTGVSDGLSKPKRYCKDGIRLCDCMG